MAIDRGPARRTSSTRRWLGVLAGAAVLALIAVSAAWSAYAAVLTGSEPAVAAFWAGMSLLLLALPVVAYLVVTRLPLQRGRRVRSAVWVVVGAAVVALAHWWLGRAI